MNLVSAEDSHMYGKSIIKDIWYAAFFILMLYTNTR